MLFRGVRASASGLALDKAPLMSAVVHGFLKSAAAELVTGHTVAVAMISSLQVYS